MAPSARIARARVDLARRLGTQGVIESDPLTGTLRMVGRLDGYLTGRSARPAKAVAIGYVRSEPRGLRSDQGRPQDVPIATGLRGHRGRASHLVDAGQARRAGVPQRPPRERDERRTPGQHHRLAGARASASRRPFRASRPTRRSVRHASTAVRRSPPRRAQTRRRSCCSRRDTAPGSPGRRSPGRTRNSSTCRWWTRAPGPCSTGRASRATTPEPRRRGSSTRATWSPPARTWRTRSRSRSSTVRSSTATTRTCGRT